VGNARHLTESYLAEMGLSQWYPRVVLTNALLPLQVNDLVIPSVSEPEPEVVANVVSKSLDEVTVTKPLSSLVSKVDALKDKPVNPRIKPIRFGLDLYVIGDWIVASSLVSNYQSSQDVTLNLIQNVLSAINAEPFNMKHHHVISWPFFSNPNADQGAESARQYVAGVIGHLVEEHKVNNILAFGGVLPKLNGWADISGTSDDMKYLVLPSLYRMMEDPLLKSKAWKAIQSSNFFQS